MKTFACISISSMIAGADSGNPQTAMAIGMLSGLVAALSFVLKHVSFTHGVKVI